MNHFALTIIGHDQPGIVARVTQILFNLGCNIADSSCTILGGQFAMILIIAHPQFINRESFGAAFEPLEKTGLSVSLRPLSAGGETSPRLPGELCLISVYGSDKPGIVYPVVKELSERQINITDLNTKLIGSPERPVYVMLIEAVLPADIPREHLAAVMDQLQKKLQVDISVRDITPVEL